MSCNNPLYGFRSTIPNESTGKFPVLFSGSQQSEWMPVPCGKCQGCLRDRSISWGIRCVHEMQYHKENSFITFTYDDKHLPKNRMLNKRHLQLFWKRLRKKYADRTIKYLACGEYGSRTLRAHYHAITFGYRPPDLVKYKENKYGQWLYFSAEMQELWEHGMCIIGNCEFGTAQYVAKYINKNSDQHNMLERIVGFVKPYNVCSQGIGKQYLIDHWQEIYRWDQCLIDGMKYKPPRYYDKWLEENAPDMFARIKDNRTEIAILNSPDLEEAHMRGVAKEQKLKGRKSDERDIG